MDAMNTRSSLRLLLALAFALALCARPAPLCAGEAGKEPCAVSPSVAGRVSSVAPDQAGAILARLSLACDEGFPLAPFEGKLAEGLAKGVAPAIIIRTLDVKLDAFRHAAAMLRDCGLQPAPEVLAVLGEAVFGGVPAKTLHAYVCGYAGREPGPFLWGLEMAVLLSRAGFDDGLTRQMLDAGFATGGLTPDWRYFVRVVLVARQRGLTDQAVAEAACAVLRGGGAPSDVSASLGFTDRDLSGRELGK